MIGKEDHLDDDDDGDDDEWEDEEEAPFQIGISPELQCALRGNEIIPEKLLSSMPRPYKSGMELVIWRPPGTIVPSEIIASISSQPMQSEPKLNTHPPNNHPHPSAPENERSSRLTLLRDPVLLRTPSVDQNSKINNLSSPSINVDVGSNDMEMETI